MIKLMVGIIFICGWILQSHYFINWDTSWLTHLATRLSKEGINTYNFFEINTPMSVYIYLPAVLIAKTFSLSNIIAVRIYVLMLALLSIFICSKLLSKESIFTKNNILITLATIFCILPVNQFGQREHIFLILIMPYLFLTIARLSNQPIYFYFAIIVGLLGGIGFAIKPFFLAPLFIIESYIVFKNKSFRSLLRAELITIGLVLFIYILSIINLQSEYLTQILPLATKYYYSGFHTPRIFFVYDTLLLFCLCVAGICLFQVNNNASGTILFLALMGLLITYLSQGIASFGRILPALGIALLIISLLLSYQLNHESKKTSYSSLAIFILSALILFMIPASSFLSIAQGAIHSRKLGSMNELITYMRSQTSGSSYYFISTSPPSLLIDYLQDKNMTSLSELSLPYWIMSGTLMRGQQEGWNSSIKNDEAIFITSVAMVLKTKKPDLVFVDKKIVFNMVFKPFDYIKYFSKNDNFKELWKQYSYSGQVFHFDVYKKSISKL